MKSKMPPKKSNYSDMFMTPDNAINILLPYIKKEWNIWECASGTGNIVKFLREREYNIFGTDIKQGDDFLMSNRSDFNCIITNPPFSLKDKWLEKCYSYGKPFALLLPITALEGLKRTSLYKKNGIQLIIPNRRINFMSPSGKGKGSWFATAWFTFGFNLPNQLNFVELI